MLQNRHVLLSAVVGLLLAAPGFAQRGTVSFPTRRLLEPHGLERAWWNQATLNPARDRVRHLVADEDVVIVQSRNGVVTVFDAHDGKKLWAARPGRADAASFPALTNGELVVLVIGTEVYALRKFSGATAWEFTLPAVPSTGPEMDANHVYVGTGDGSMFAFDLQKIERLHREKLLPQWSAQTVAWRYKTDKTVTTPPVSSGRVVNFANKGGSMYCVTTADRNLVFQFETDSPILAPMTRSKRLLYLASEDFKLYCLNMENGTTRWMYNTGLPIRKPARVIDQDVFITPSRGGLHCIDSLFGHRKWLRPRMTAFVAASPSRVYATDGVGNLDILDRESGAVRGSLGLRNFSVRLSNGRTDRIYLATPTGLVVCIREKGREFPLYYMYPERRPILPEFAPSPPKPAIK